MGPSTRTLLHYTILDRLGAGGMGVVYRALDTRLDRVVALKFLPSTVAADDGARRRLLVEARAAARLDHPAIGVVYGIEGLDAEPFIVMALYEGQDLRERLRSGPLAIHDAIDYGLQIARGLERAHQHGVIHRDIKPANLLLTHDGLVKILDFGLARRGALDGLTVPGQVVGTPAYLAPEQARGQAIDHRADLWALGTVLYEMLTGVPAFATDDGLAATLLRILRDEPESLERLRPEAPSRLVANVRRALMKDPADRYDSASELIRDLEAVAAVVTAGAGGGVAAATPEAAPAATLAAPPLRPAMTPTGADGAPAAAAGPPPTPSASLARLPTPSAPLVGRQDELALAELHLADRHCRILTLFGIGGTGKTRLAIEIARQQALQGRYPDGVRFVALEALDDPASLPTALAAALGLTLHGDDDVMTQLFRAVGERSMLLVLDNFEHLMDGAGVASELARACPNATLLVTSRERLNLEEEWVLPLGGLAVPPADPAAEPGQALDYPAVSLFVQRARRADIRFALADEDVPHVCEVCRLVQGLPLGVELAAAWVRSVRCQEIAHELRSNLDFLESGSRNVSARHRSLRAAFEYSLALLTAEQQQLLEALSVFRGGFTKEAARAVTGARVQDLVALADKSLLAVSVLGRYHVHPLLHQFTAERLGEHPDQLARLRDAHGRYYHQLLRDREEDLGGARHSDAYEALVPDEANLRSAWSWAVEGPHVQMLVASAVPLEALFDVKGRHLEAATLFGEAVDGIGEADPSRHEALGVLSIHQAWAYFSLGRLPSARAAAERGLAWLRPAGEGIKLLKALNTVAATAYGAGEYVDARASWTEALALAREIGQARYVGAVLGNLGAVERALGEFEASHEHQTEALVLAREAGDPAGIISALSNLAALAQRTGALAEARAQLEEALQLARDVGYDVMVPTLVHGLGVVHFKQLEYDQALTRHREALRLAREVGDERRVAYVLTSIAATHLALAQLDEVPGLLGESLGISWSNQDLPTALQAVRWLAHWHAEAGRAADAVALITMVDEHPATDRAAVDVSAASLVAWSDALLPEEAAAARARGRELGLGEVVARTLREFGAARPNEPGATDGADR